MSQIYELTRAQQYTIEIKSKATQILLNKYHTLSDDMLLIMIRALLGQHRYPVARTFLEKGLVSLKKMLEHTNPHGREKIIQNLVINECIRGQALRKHIQNEIELELPVLLVISPTMRCPLRCYGCYSAQYAQDSDLDYGAFDKLITEAKSLGIYFFVISGGEPFIYPGIHDLFAKHNDAWFQVYTSGATIDENETKRLSQQGNVIPCISVEGFEQQTDSRRGKGHFQKIMSAFDNLRRMQVPFGISTTVTRENNEIVMSDEFIEFYMNKGACLGWYFQYMPIGREPHFEMVPTPQQRIDRFHTMEKLRKKYDILLSDFWNDGPVVGGCIAARRYLHVNHAGNVEPCVFCQISTDSIYEKTLLEILQTSAVLTAIRKRQPYNDNYLRPCMIIDNPHILAEVLEESHATATCGMGASEMIKNIYPQLQELAKDFGVLADKIWTNQYEKNYRPVIEEAHELNRRYRTKKQDVKKHIDKQYSK